MSCPLCDVRKPRRHCPALGREICPVCCGTKRLVEIACPPDCGYLASARHHPAAALRRQREDDWNRLRNGLRDLNDRQSEFLLTFLRFLKDYRGVEWQQPHDGDVAEAADALASTLETASKGVLYEHRASSAPAQRLLEGLRGVWAELGKGGGSSAERDAAVVLRRVEELARGEQREGRPPDSLAAPRAFFELLARMLRPGDTDEETRTAGPSRLIVP